MKPLYFTLFVSLFSLSILHATAPRPYDTNWDVLPELNLKLSQRAQYTQSKQRDSSGKNLKSGTLETALGHEEQLTDGFYNINAFFEYNKYGASTVIPLKDFYSYGLDLFYMENQWNEWGIWLMGSTEWAARYNVSGSQWFKSGGIYKLGLGPSYDVSEDLTFYAGAYLVTKLEAQNTLLPVAGVYWQATPKLHIRTANGLFITYDTFEDGKVLLDLSSYYQFKQFRLKDREITTTVGSAGQAMEDKGWFTDAGLTYTFTDNFWMRGNIGLVTERELKAKSNGYTLSRVKTKPGFNLGLHASYHF